MQIAPWFVAVGLAASALATDGTPVDGKPDTDIVSSGTTGDIHVVAEPTLAGGRLVLHVVAVNRGSAVVPFGPGDVVLASAEGTPIAFIPRATLLAEAASSGPGAGGGAASAYGAPTLSSNGAGQLDTTGYTGTMGAVTAGVPQDTLDRRRAAAPKPNVAALDAVLLKPLAIKPGGADGGQIVSERLKLRGDRRVVLDILFAGERHVVRLPAPNR